MTNRRIASLWLDALAAERGTALSSLNTYKVDVACYVGWLGDRPLAQVTRRAMADYLAYLDSRCLAHATVARRRSVATSIHRFMLVEGLVVWSRGVVTLS